MTHAKIPPTSVRRATKISRPTTSVPNERAVYTFIYIGDNGKERLGLSGVRSGGGTAEACGTPNILEIYMRSDAPRLSCE